MSWNIRMRSLWAVSLVATCALAASVCAEEPKQPNHGSATANSAASAGRPKAKPLAVSTKKGLSYLANQQHASGGWGQGGGWRTGTEGGRVEGAEVQDPPDVANTAVATLALLRGGSTPRAGQHAAQVAKGVLFIIDKIEKIDAESPFVTDVRGTQLQSKIGQYVDTFLAALVLAELKGKMPDEAANERLVQALDKTLQKIERHQKADGTFEGNTGWASVLSQALCSKALNRAAQGGAAVKQELLDRDSKLAANGVDVQRRDFGAVAAAGRAVGGVASRVDGRGRTALATEVAASAPSDAGVSIYAFSAKAGGLQDAVNTARPAATKAQQVLADAAAPDDAKREAQTTLERVRRLEETNDAAVSGIIKRLDDKEFIAGFGNNGGEEFLSYMNISETLLAAGGEKWQSWDKSISENLSRVQNEDGSWSGHHCITGRTFCTAAALLTLVADRAPVPVASKLSEGK